jgi:hypothetical protein
VKDKISVKVMWESVSSFVKEKVFGSEKKQAQDK